MVGDEDTFGEGIPTLPEWVAEWLGHVAPSALVRDTSGEITWHMTESSKLALAEFECPEAYCLDGSALSRLTYRAYETILRDLGRRKASYPIRCWNFLPGINEPAGHGATRYAAFNEGRFAALRDWTGAEEVHPGRLPASTAVGHASGALRIAVLAGTRPGAALENPRQIPAWKYSPRFGRMPPCFARGTLLRGESEDAGIILIAGTASVVGETTLHVGDAAAQLEESLRNVAEVIAEGRRTAIEEGDARPRVGEVAANASPLAVLRSVDHLRVYGVGQAELRAARKMLPRRCVNVRRIEYVIAEMCRPELLVEVEGVARPEI